MVLELAHLPRDVAPFLVAKDAGEPLGLQFDEYALAVDDERGFAKAKGVARARRTARAARDPRRRPRTER
jgi:hypothetical protein